MTEIRQTFNAARTNLAADALRKAAWVLLYAHEEGFFKAACQVYLKAINAEHLRFAELEETLATQSLRPVILGLGNGHPFFTWPRGALGLPARAQSNRAEFD